MAKVLIIGYGDIGAALAKELIEAGHEVTVLRRTDAIDILGVKFIKADVSDINSLKSHCFAVDQVVYILSPSDGGVLAYKSVFEHGVRNVLTVFKEQCPQVAITFVSSTRVYGQDNGEWVDEESLTKPKEERGELLLRAENAFLAFNKQATIVRFSGIYGRSSYFLDQIRLGIAIQKTPPHYTNRIHRTDCIGVLAFIVNKKANKAGATGIYIGSDSDGATKWDVACYLAKSMNIPLPKPLTLDVNAGQNKRIRNKRLTELGYIFKYPSYQQGYGGSDGK